MIDGWVERPGARRTVDFLDYLKALHLEGYDIAALVAKDYSHVVAVICDARQLRGARAQLAWHERAIP